jgi:glycosyltransferase involved in cell wall biosynthesis
VTPVHIGFNAHLLSFRPGYRRAGVSQYIEQLLRQFVIDALQPDDVLTVYNGHGDPESVWVSERNTIRYRSSHLPVNSAPGRMVWEQFAAPVVTMRDQIDVLFCPVNVVPLAARVPSVVTVHDVAFLAHPEAFHASKRRYLDFMTRRSVHRARRVIAVSEHTKGDLVDRYHLPPDRVTVIPNAADRRYRPADDADSASSFRAANDLPDRFILFVGTLEPRKNLRRLVEAFSSVSARAPDVKLVIVGGSGWLTSDLAPLVHDRGLTDRIIFTGYVSDDDLPRWYQAATIFCYPSLYEGFGLPVLEAMACGTPVVTSNTSAIPEEAGDAAILIDPTDVAALAEALAALIDDPTRREEMRAAGIERAQLYAWDRTARATLNVSREATHD